MTEYPGIYCRKQFDVIHYVTFCWMTCDIMRLAMLQFETKLQKCIRMGITIFKIFIWGGISLDIRWKTTFYCSARVAVKLNFRPYSQRYTSPNENFYKWCVTKVAHCTFQIYHSEFKLDIDQNGLNEVTVWRLLITLAIPSRTQPGLNCGIFEILPS